MLRWRWVPGVSSIPTPFRVCCRTADEVGRTVCRIFAYVRSSVKALKADVTREDPAEVVFWVLLQSPTNLEGVQ